MAKFYCNNQECPAFKNEIIKNNFIIKIINNITKYFDKEGKEIKCKFCNSVLIEKSEKNEFCINFNKFDSLSTNEKRKILKKRISLNEKKREVEEKRYRKNKIIKSYGNRK